MLKSISFGTFYPGNSVLHRLQARTKLIAAIWLVITLLIANHRQWHLASYIMSIILVIGSIFLARISLREFGRRLWLLILLIFSSMFLSVFGSAGDSPVIWHLGPWLPSYGTVSQSLFIVGCTFLGLFVISWFPPLRSWCQRKFWLRLIRNLLLLLVIADLYFFWLTNGFDPSHHMTIGPLVVTQQGAWLSLVSFMVFFVLYTFSTLLTMTTSPIALIEGLTLLLSPLKYLKLPVDDFALMILLALRFIPTLLDEADQLMKAQVARGADIMHGTMRERFQSLAIFFVPLVQNTLRRASELATALDARGYRSERGRTLLHEKKLGKLDYYILGIVLCLTTIPLFL
ncbi:hypothetical protein KDA_00410 [Dictyobacter alpinus]|uniref:Energy-coupling factor transporter transmembrane protein EcfT n=1 Tax=Dictyobacter alpinus TaxID=2014873 RepID=A0A402AZR4_9CHLR|nr:energy-coupling factor transporter transmembrane component T [Dictyobacter alpinus]GCE24557.1 hypothetical protein KDA_00410 [Dictyobacter alpinus]